MQFRLYGQLRKRWQQWFSGRSPAQSGVVTLTNSRIYILPTRLGWGFTAALVVLIVLGINYSNNIIYGLAFWLAGIALVALVQTQRQLSGLQLKLLPIAAVFAGNDVVLKLRVMTPDKRNSRGLSMSLAWPTQPSYLQRVHIEAGRSGILELSVPTVTRGTFSAPLLRVVSNYPLGLFQSWSFIHQLQHTVIYPRPAANAVLPAETPLLQGESAAAQLSGSDEYDGLRRYREGDSMRHIAWKATAQKASRRHDGQPTAEDLSTKAFYAEAAKQRRFELTAAMAVAGNLEGALSLLCRWVLDARAASIPYELVIDSDTETGSDPELSALALYHPEPSGASL